MNIEGTVYASTSDNVQLYKRNTFVGAKITIKLGHQYCFSQLRRQVRYETPEWCRIALIRIRPIVYYCSLFHCSHYVKRIRNPSDLIGHQCSGPLVAVEKYQGIPVEMLEPIYRKDT